MTGRRRSVEGGVSARSRRGGFARTWWGRAFVAAVEGVSEPGRLARGRSYARAGQVVSYRIEAGEVTAEVQGSQPRPFAVVLRIRPLREEELALLIDTIRTEPGMLADIAAGELPPALGPRLLPTTVADFDFGCTCPDPAWPCKHAVAVCYLLAERLDEHPRDILGLRGLDLDTLIGGMENEQPPSAFDDPYGDRLVLPELPKRQFRSALEDLDPVQVRSALRMVAEDEATAAAGLRELRALYERLGR